MSAKCISAAGALAVAVIAACSAEPSGVRSAAPPIEHAGTGSAHVVVAGRDRSVSGPIRCDPAGDDIAIGIGNPSTGVQAVVGDGPRPVAHTVALGAVDGVELNYSDGAPGQGRADATKVGDSYTITGEAVGSNPLGRGHVTEPFRVEVTCP